jgi:hypothetical protein
MRNQTFKSVLHPDKIAYRLTDDWDWNKKGNAPLSVYLTQFETYGDGMTQHSGDWAVQFADITDLCISLTQAIVADFGNDAWKQLSYFLHESNQELIAFALTIKHRDDKAQWFNLADRKLSSSESKRHDKRWEHVESWHDGTPASALAIILNANQHCDWLQKLCWADDLRTACNYPYWEDIFKPTKDLAGDWQQAFHALRACGRAVAAMDYASRAADSALFNSKPQPAEAMPEVPAVAAA